MSKLWINCDITKKRFILPTHVLASWSKTPPWWYSFDSWIVTWPFDGRNPAPPEIHKTLWIMVDSPYPLVQDFFHQQYLMSFYCFLFVYDNWHLSSPKMPTKERAPLSQVTFWPGIFFPTQPKNSNFHPGKLRWIQEFLPIFSISHVLGTTFKGSTGTTVRSLEPTRFGLSQDTKWSELEAQLDQDLKEAEKLHVICRFYWTKNMLVFFL